MENINNQVGQVISSKNTSVNTIRLPAIYNKLNWEKLLKWSPRLMVVDYGCGRETSHIEKFLIEKGVETYIPVDPNWKPMTWDTVRSYVRVWNIQGEDRKTIVICSNVLNVISPWQEVVKTKMFIDALCVPYFYTVYEGDKSGIGKESKKDCWQWNKPIKDYQHSRFECVYKGVLTRSIYAQFLTGTREGGDIIEEGIFITSWDDYSVEIEGFCKVNMRTHEVYDVRYTDEQMAMVDELSEAWVNINGTIYDVYDKNVHRDMSDEDQKKYYWAGTI